MSDTLARLAHRHGVDGVYEAAKEWCEFVEGQKAILAKYGMAEPEQRDGEAELREVLGFFVGEDTVVDQAGRQ